jgi:PPM family protein phosphatase
VEELLSMGDFSSRCGLSAKMLRSYAAAGLLIPAAVDARSGYRYYATGQLQQARIIALLRRAGIAPDDITGFFAHPGAAQLEYWDREIVRASAARRQVVIRSSTLLPHRPASAPTSVTHGVSRPAFVAYAADRIR